MIHRIAVACSLFLIAASALASTPPIFHEGAYESAKAEAAESGKLLLVDFTDSSDINIKIQTMHMDENAWSDPDVVSWVRENAVVVRVALEDQVGITRASSVAECPGVLMIRDDREIDRRIGHLFPEELLDWLRNASEGRTHRDILLERLEKLEGEFLVGRDRFIARWNLAKAELNLHLYEEATERYALLWEECKQSYPRNSEFLHASMFELKRLVTSHQPARVYFSSLCDDEYDRFADTVNYGTLRHWAVLCRALGNESQLLAWYDRAAQNQQQTVAIERVSNLLNDPLIERGRWADYGRLLRQPVRLAESSVWSLEPLDEDPKNPLSDELRSLLHQRTLERCIERVSWYHTGLLATGDTIAPMLVANVLFEALEGQELNNAKTALVTHALNAGYPHMKHLEWAQEAGDDELASRVRKELDKQD